MKEGEKDWGHTIDDDDPVQGYVNDPTRINEIINQQFDKTEKTGRLVNKATLHKKEQNSKTETNYGGYTVDNDDPLQGYVDDPAKIQDYFRSFGDELFGDGQKITANDEEETIIANEKEIDKGEADKQEASNIHELQPSRIKTTEKDKKLAEVFKKGMEIRDRYKDPGNPRYRLLSVAAVEMEPINQSDNATEKVNSINKAVEKAAKAAVGGEEMDDYSGDTVAGVQAYIVEDLIGDDANQVWIGTTETIVNPNGQVGKDPETYKNLVVLRWVKNSTNHVFVFSPRKEAAMYALVDDSMGDSWKKTFLMAGAVNGDERREIMSVNHDQSGDDYLHEKTLEKMIVRMMKKKEAEAMNVEGMSFEDKAKALLSISKEYERLAHLTGQIIKATPPSEAADRGESIRNQIRNIQEKANA